MAKKDNQPDNPAKKVADPLMEPVRQYLEKRAAEDPQFAEKYKNPKKSLNECCRYIYGEARKRAGGSNCVYIAQEEVYGWAVHYYDEDDIKVSGSGYTGKATAVASPAPAPKPVELTEEQKAAAEKRALEQYEADARKRIEEKEKARRKAEADKKKAAREEAERRRKEDGDLFNLFGL